MFVLLKLLFFSTSTIAYHCTQSLLNGLLQPELSSWPDPGILRASPAHLPRHRGILAALLEWHAPALGLHMGPSAAWNGFLPTPFTTVCKHIGFSSLHSTNSIQIITVCFHLHGHALPGYNTARSVPCSCFGPQGSLSLVHTRFPTKTW